MGSFWLGFSRPRRNSVHFLWPALVSFGWNYFGSLIFNRSVLVSQALQGWLWAGRFVVEPDEVLATHGANHSKLVNALQPTPHNCIFVRHFLVYRKFMRAQIDSEARLLRLLMLFGHEGRLDCGRILQRMLVRSALNNQLKRTCIYSLGSRQIRPV